MDRQTDRQPDRTTDLGIKAPTKKSKNIIQVTEIWPLFITYPVQKIEIYMFKKNI